MNNENEICGSEVCQLCEFPTIEGFCVNTNCRAGLTYVLADFIKPSTAINKMNYIMTSKSVDLTKLHVNLQDKLELFYRIAFNEFLKKDENFGYNIIVTQGLRTIAEQDALFNSGRGVTNAKGGQSPHNYGVAFDIALSCNGKVDWFCFDKYNELGSIGIKVGLEWGGNFKKANKPNPDLPHYQLANWRQYKK